MRIALPDHAGDADVWFASVGEVKRLIDPAKALTPAELERAGTLQLADRERFAAGRALLRYALTEAVNGATPPSAWRFREGSFGKPEMAEGLPPIAFNLSHAGACVAVATSRAGPVGIDIESIAPADCGNPVLDVLTEAERAFLYRVEVGRRPVEFIRLWTVKEACAKALGLGVSLDFRRLEVSVDPLRVRAPRALLGTSADLRAAATTIQREGLPPFLLCVAQLINNATSRC